MANKILVTKHIAKEFIMPGETTIQIGVVLVVQSFTGSEIIPMMGVLDFSVENQGTTKVYIIDKNIEILPGATRNFNKSTPYPYAENIKMFFENDYQLSQNPLQANNNNANPN
jgi:hypothetical protein